MPTKLSPYQAAHGRLCICRWKGSFIKAVTEEVQKQEHLNALADKLQGQWTYFPEYSPSNNLFLTFKVASLHFVEGSHVVALFTSQVVATSARSGACRLFTAVHTEGEAPHDRSFPLLWALVLRHVVGKGKSAPPPSCGVAPAGLAGGFVPGASGARGAGLYPPDIGVTGKAHASSGHGLWASQRTRVPLWDHKRGE